MSTEEVLEALERYTKESNETDRETATKLGVTTGGTEHLAAESSSTRKVRPGAISRVFETGWVYLAISFPPGLAISFPPGCQKTK